jgi:hypothetical protein
MSGAHHRTKRLGLCQQHGDNPQVLQDRAGAAAGKPVAGTPH